PRHGRVALQLVIRRLRFRHRTEPALSSVGFRLVGLSVQAGLEKASGLSPSDRFAQKKGVWNFEALKTPAFIAAGEFQTPFFWAKPPATVSWLRGSPAKAKIPATWPRIG